MLPTVLTIPLTGATHLADPRMIELERNFICPERLPDDDARTAAVRNFVQRYGVIRPASKMGERLAARDRLLVKQRCRPETQQHSFPEI